MAATTLQHGVEVASEPRHETRRHVAQIQVIRDSPPSIVIPLTDSTHPNSSDGDPLTPRTTLRHFGKRKARPILGVTTFGPSTNIAIDASPLSPVVASPRSVQHTTRVSKTGSSVAVGHTSTSPLVSPDISLGFSPANSEAFTDGPTRFINPFGTTGMNDEEHSSARQNQSIQIQYKPRKRVPTPRRLSFDRRGSMPIVIRSSAPRSTLDNTQNGVATAGDDHQRFGSLWGSRTSSKGLSPWRRFSSLWDSDTSIPDRGQNSKLASGAPSTNDSNVVLGSVSEDGHLPRRLNAGRRFSNILPFSRRISIPHGNSAGRSGGEENDVHAKLMIHGHISRPHPPPLVTGVSPHIQRGSASRLSTITIRSSDGWLSTVPVDEARPNSLSVQPPTAVPLPFNHLTNSSSSSLTPTSTSLTQPSAAHASRDEHESSHRTFISLSTPPSPIAEAIPPQRSRPHSFQNPSFSRVNSLTGTQETDGSVRLLDVREAAALRRSIEFDDRVRKSENVLRRALYGSDAGSRQSPSHLSSSPGRSGNRSRSVSAGRNVNQLHRSRMKEIPKIPTNVGNGGGVFLSNAVPLNPLMRRPSPLRSDSTPEENSDGHLYAHAAWPSSKDSVQLNGQLDGLPEEEVRRTDHNPSARPIDVVNTVSPASRYPPFARRLGRRISRIFVGKETAY
ncbi:hypothetical protein FRC17_011150 [Serendipita sp. 399]|nr:hypothetical protein FRC17_011150 [Serendipita sp. 399]